MVEQGEMIVVIPDERTRPEVEAQVLGSEDEFVWLYCPESREIYRSNPECILEHEGRKVLYQYDYCKALDDVFDESGQCESGVFWYASEAVRIRMTKLLQAWKLIDP